MINLVYICVTECCTRERRRRPATASALETSRPQDTCTHLLRKYDARQRHRGNLRISNIEIITFSAMIHVNNIWTLKSLYTAHINTYGKHYI